MAEHGIDDCPSCGAPQCDPKDCPGRVGQLEAKLAEVEAHEQVLVGRLRDCAAFMKSAANFLREHPDQNLKVSPWFEGFTRMLALAERSCSVANTPALSQEDRQQLIAVLDAAGGAKAFEQRFACPGGLLVDALLGHHIKPGDRQVLHQIIQAHVLGIAHAARSA